MTVSLAMLLGVGMVGTGLPRRLELLRQTGVRPSVLIAVWALSIAGLLAAAGGGVVLLFVPGHGLPGGVLGATGGCGVVADHGVIPRVEMFSGLLGLLILLAGAARWARIGGQLANRRSRSRRERLAVLRLAARVESGSPAILWLAHDRPLAFSVSGHPSFLVATDGLRRQLTKEQSDAVLEHERAHVRCHHHFGVALADVFRSWMPFLPLFRDAPHAIRELVELAADDAAVRRCGPAAVLSALIRMTDADAPGTALAFGRDALDVRLDRLTTSVEPVGWIQRVIGYGSLCLAPILPLLAAAVVLVVLWMVSCAGL